MVCSPPRPTELVDETDNTSTRLLASQLGIVGAPAVLNCFYVVLLSMDAVDSSASEFVSERGVHV